MRAFPAKRTVGDQVRVEADIFTDGHDAIAASLLAHREGSEEWTEIPMQPLVNDRWEASFRVGELGRYGFKVQGWVDHFETWRRDLLKRIKAESDATVDYLIGADLVDAGGTESVWAETQVWLRERAAVLRSKGRPATCASMRPIPCCTSWRCAILINDSPPSRTRIHHRGRSGARAIQFLV